MTIRTVSFIFCFPLLVLVARAGALEFRDLLPEIKQAAPAGELKIFRGEDLWDYIDGGAEPYYDYGFIKVLAQKYTWAGIKRPFSIDIYDMGSVAGAFGVFSSFRLAGSESAAVGTECQFNGAALDFYHGQYYVQVGGPSSSPELKQKLVALGRATAEKINTPVKKPEELDLLPVKDRVAGTEKYTKHNLMGYEFLKEAWGAEYKTGNDGRAVLQVLLYPDRKGAAAAYEKYFKENKTAETASLAGAEKTFFNKDKYAGLVGACLKDDRVIIVTGAPDKKCARELMSRQIKTIHK